MPSSRTRTTAAAGVRASQRAELKRQQQKQQPVEAQPEQDEQEPVEASASPASATSTTSDVAAVERSEVPGGESIHDAVVAQPLEESADPLPAIQPHTLASRLSRLGGPRAPIATSHALVDAAGNSATDTDEDAPVDESAGPVQASATSLPQAAPHVYRIGQLPPRPFWGAPMHDPQVDPSGCQDAANTRAAETSEQAHDLELAPAGGEITSSAEDPRADERGEDNDVVSHLDAVAFTGPGDEMLPGSREAEDDGEGAKTFYVGGTEGFSDVVDEAFDGSEAANDDGMQEELTDILSAVDAHIAEQELQELTWRGAKGTGARVNQPLAAPQAQDPLAFHGTQEPDAGLIEPSVVTPVKNELDISAEDEDFIRRYREASLRDAAPLVPADTARPQSGWRGATVRVTAGRVMPTPTRQQTEHENLLARIRRPLRTGRHIAVISFGSGVGKTVTTGLLGQVFSTIRDDSIAAVDSDPVAGNLLHRFATADNLSLQHMLQQHDRRPIQSIRQLSDYAVRSHRLHLYRADHSRAAGPFGEAEHAQALELLMRFHDVVITDMGPNGVHEMPKAFDTVDDLVIVAGTNLDAATRSSQALDFLEELGYHDLVKRACAVMVSRSSKDSALARARRGGGVHVESLMDHFQRRCGSVVLVPYSAALADGVHVSIDTVGVDVRAAYMEAAAALAGNFQPHGHASAPALGIPFDVQPTQVQPHAPRAPRQHWWQRTHRPVLLPEGALGDAPPSLTDLPHYGRERQQ